MSMKMEEKALLINIAAIVAKDIGIDKKTNFKRAKFPTRQFKSLLQDHDDEADLFFFNSLHSKKAKFDQKSLTGSYFENAVKKANAQCSRIKKEEPAGKLKTVQELNTEEFRKHLHMNRSTFEKLMEAVTPLLESCEEITSHQINIDQFVSLALWHLSTGEPLEKSSERFSIPIEINQWSVHKFCSIISKNLDKFIQWPLEDKPRDEILKGFEKLGHGDVPKLFGIIGTRQIEVFLESEDENVVVTLQAVCTADQLFTDCFLEISTSYSFANSPLAQSLNENPYHMPDKTFLIGDETFPLRAYLIKPFPAQDIESKIQFNKLLTEKLLIIEGAFDRMMQRFHSLGSGLMEAKDFDQLKEIIETICALQNFCQKYNDNFVFNMPESERPQKVTRVGEEVDRRGKLRRNELLNVITP